jgi:hypothetical protein
MKRSFMYLRHQPKRAFLCGFDHIGARVSQWRERRITQGRSVKLASQLLP